MIPSLVTVALLILLPMFYIHLTLCLATAFVYREAYRVNPGHQSFPPAYTRHKRPTWAHFWRLFFRPWETIPRIGTRITTELVIIEFTIPHAKTKLNPRIHTAPSEPKHQVTFN